MHILSTLDSAFFSNQKICITHFNGSFFASRRHPLSIWAEFEAVDGLTVAFVGETTPFSSNIPQFQVGIAGSRTQKISIRMKIDASNPSFMAG